MDGEQTQATTNLKLREREVIFFLEKNWMKIITLQQRPVVYKIWVFGLNLGRIGCILHCSIYSCGCTTGCYLNMSCTLYT